MYSNILKNEFKISQRILDIANEVEREVEGVYKSIDEIKAFNQYKVMRAMQCNKLSETHFFGTTGYGYDDRGREVLDNVYKDIFKTEDALVRHQIVSGTHALAICLFAVLRPGDELLSITGKPYDTLEEVIGIRGENTGSLKEYGITYSQVELLDNGKFNIDGIKSAINDKTKMVLIQRSRGYTNRPAIFVNDIGEIVKFVKSINRDITIMVDNCYGEFVEEREPTEVGVDIVAGSLIKNPGGGLAPTGGYIVGKEECIKMCAYRLTSPGLGKKVGASLGHNRLMFQGLFFAPHVVSESLKGGVFCSALMKKLGYAVSPLPEETRSDIIQAVTFADEKSLILFCQGIQRGSVVDSHVVPEPWNMPGYDSPVIMAAGSFIQGASIELSADAPIKPPYTAYVQGGLVYEQAKLGVMTAAQILSDVYRR